jgi:hypothetical protein
MLQIYRQPNKCSDKVNARSDAGRGDTTTNQTDNVSLPEFSSLPKLVPA